MRRLLGPFTFLLAIVNTQQLAAEYTYFLNTWHSNDTLYAYASTDSGYEDQSLRKAGSAVL
jgi:hypothetical protein